MIVHALAAGRPSSDTLCGSRSGSLPGGESCVDARTADPDLITCSRCREQLEEQTPSIAEYAPKSTLIVPEHHPHRARYPFIDVHSHQNPFQAPEKIFQLLEEMDGLNLQILVNLSGGCGSTLEAGIRNLHGSHPNRFVTFANIDFSGINAPDFPDRVARQFERDVRNGAGGLKIFKNFGTDFVDIHGKRIPIDDPRFDCLFETCVGLKTPVLIHSADPQSFYDPVDKHNERWLELKLIPSRRHPPDPAWHTLVAEQHRLFARHPKTIFINAHLGWLAGDLDELGRLLDRLPNVYTEIGAIIAELGRQPRQARKWFVLHQDRVLFGKDGWNPVEYHTYFRVLETADEYFDHYRRYQAGWKIYGLDLPDEVLRKLYFENALRILPGADKKLFG